MDNKIIERVLKKHNVADPRLVYWSGANYKKNEERDAKALYDKILELDRKDK